MANEQAEREIISVLSEAGKGISFWIEHVERDELDQLLTAAVIIRDTKARALHR